ncbi:MAG: hypothetical protein R3C32_10905 [Chloroflexota bacterium]
MSDPTTRAAATRPSDDPDVAPLDEFEIGFLVGILVGEGHFGGDGRQPQVTLRMHTDHEALFRWLVDRIPGSRLYGPYHHGGRSYLQWMARGECLRERIVPLLEARLSRGLDERAWRRFRQMRDDYRI